MSASRPIGGDWRLRRFANGNLRGGSNRFFRNPLGSERRISNFAVGRFAMPRRSAGVARIGFPNNPIKARVRGQISRGGIRKERPPGAWLGLAGVSKAPEPSHLRRRLGSKGSGGDSNIKLYYHRLHVQIVPSGRTENGKPVAAGEVTNVADQVFNHNWACNSGA
jgi:hypothetical protein